MNKTPPAIIQDSKIVLSRSKNLIGITNKILTSRSSILAEVLVKKPFVNTGHTYNVNSVAFSPDGQTVLSGSGDATLKLWDIHSGKCIRTLEGHTGTVYSVAFSPDGQTVLSGSGDATLKLWDVHSGKCLRTFEGHTKWVYSVAFSPNGQTVLSGSWDKTLRLWDVHSGKCIRTLEGHTDTVYSVAFSPDGQTVLSGSGDNTLKLWNADSGECIRIFKGHADGFNDSVAFSPDGQTVLSGSRVWDIHSGECIRTFKGHTDRVISPDSKTEVSGIRKGVYPDSRNNTLKLLDIETGRTIRIFEGHAISHFIALLPDGKTVLLKNSECTLSLFDISQEKVIKTFDISFERDNLYEYDIARIALSTDGKKILLLYRYVEKRDNISYYEAESLDIISGKRRFRTHVKDAFTINDKEEVIFIDRYSENILRFGTKSLKGHSDCVTSAVFSPDGKTILSGSRDKTLKLWDISTGNEIRTFEGHTSFILYVAFSPDGKTALSGSWDNTLKLWDISTGSEIRTFQGHMYGVFSPDGKTILTGGECLTLDVKTGRTIRTFEEQTCLVNKIVFSPNGEMAFSGSNNETLILWNIKTGTWLMKMIAYMHGEWVAITPDGYFNHSPNGRQYILVNPTDMSADVIDDASYNHYYRPNGLLREHNTSFNLPKIEINEDEIPF